MIDQVLGRINPYFLHSVESGLQDISNETGKQITQWKAIQEQLFDDMPALDNIDTLELIDGSVLPKITRRTTMRTCQIMNGLRRGGGFHSRCVLVKAAKQLQQQGLAQTTVDGSV